MEGIAFLLFGTIITSIFWIFLWRKKLASINDLNNHRITSLKQNHLKIYNSEKDKNNSLVAEVNQLKGKLNSYKMKLAIAELEIARNVEKLKEIITSNPKENTRFYLIKESLSRLGYQCIFHPEESHIEEIETVEEIEDEPYSCEGYCDSMDSNGNCYNQDCILNTWYTPSKTEVKKIRKEKIIDKQAYVEVTKQIN